MISLFIFRWMKSASGELYLNRGHCINTTWSLGLHLIELQPFSFDPTSNYVYIYI